MKSDGHRVFNQKGKEMFGLLAVGGGAFVAGVFLGDKIKPVLVSLWTKLKGLFNRD